MGVTIRRATEDDADLLSKIALKIFLDTFGPQNNPRDVEIHAARSYGPEIQLCELQDPGKAYLIAEVDGVPAGFAMLGEAKSESSHEFESPVELFRFYVDKEWHGQGVAQQMMDAVEDFARSLGGQTLCLGVWEHNPRAIRFYEKIGFRDAGSQAYLLGGDLQTDRVMVRDIPS
ncbi:MAG: GNAT family N-acetyltransferase [Gemmatimonadales bacterium]